VFALSFCIVLLFAGMREELEALDEANKSARGAAATAGGGNSTSDGDGGDNGGSSESDASTPHVCATTTLLNIIRVLSNSGRRFAGLLPLMDAIVRQFLLQRSLTFLSSRQCALLTRRVETGDDSGQTQVRAMISIPRDYEINSLITAGKGNSIIHLQSLNYQFDLNHAYSDFEAIVESVREVQRWEEKRVAVDITELAADSKVVNDERTKELQDQGLRANFDLKEAYIGDDDMDGAEFLKQLAAKRAHQKRLDILDARRHALSHRCVLSHLPPLIPWRTKLQPPPLRTGTGAGASSVSARQHDTTSRVKSRSRVSSRRASSSSASSATDEFGYDNAVRETI
jgi:hypothetical protein